MSNYDLKEVLLAARNKLLANSAFAGLIGTDIGSDTIDPTTYSGGFNDGWVFYGVGDDLAPERSPATTGTSSVTLGFRNTWSSPNEYNTADFRQLQFIILSDPTRISSASSGLLSSRDAEDKCFRIASIIKNEFNDVANQVHWWGETYIISCQLYSDLQIRDVIGEDGLVRGDLRFKLILG